MSKSAYVIKWKHRDSQGVGTGGAGCRVVDLESTDLQQIALLTCENVNDARKVVHAFVTSRLDYCNSSLFVYNHSLRSVQLILKAAATVLTGSGEREITFLLNWLFFIGSVLNPE